ncbi:hypothetical protein [Nocardia sp. Marseille-Q1738]
MTLVLNEHREALLMYRHRFIIDRWVWELPCGYVDHAEDVAFAADHAYGDPDGVREVELCVNTFHGAEVAVPIDSAG